MKSPTEIAAIPDAEARLDAAVAALRPLETKAERARADRDTAIQVAHKDQGVRKVVIYRDTLGIARALCERIVARAPAVRPDVPNALTKAKKAHDRVTALKPTIEEYKQIRDATMLTLMNGEHGGDPVSNADIARRTGLSTARVAQMRTGVTHTKSAEKRLRVVS